MFCDHAQRISTLAVEEPEVFEEDFWQDHFALCGVCREEWKGYTETLAVFRQLERERVGQCPPALAWEKFSAVMAEERRRWRGGWWFSLPVAAAFSSVLAAGVLAGWLLWSTPGRGPGEQAAAPVAAPHTARPGAIARGEGAAGAPWTRPGTGRVAPAGGVPLNFVGNFGDGAQEFPEKGPLRRIVVTRSQLGGRQMGEIGQENSQGVPIQNIPMGFPANVTPAANRGFSVNFPVK